MQSFTPPCYPPTVILRHRRENLKKCSLRGLEARPDLRFLTYPRDKLPELPDYVVLSLDGPDLTADDAGYGLLILDGTWRYAHTMHKQTVEGRGFIRRKLPVGWTTAYPRRQHDCPNPEQGLASVEAIFAAYCILGRDTHGLLDHYHWKDQFLENNSRLI